MMELEKRKRSHWLMGVAGAALCFGPLSAAAQTVAAGDQTGAVTGPAAEPDADEDKVVVTGRRPLAESEAAALEVQREADSVVSVLSADAIGNLPDQNIAFAIGRLPGIGIE